MRKALITAAVMAVSLLIVIGVGVSLERTSSIKDITPNSPCPATGCANGNCHGYEQIPEPDGTSLMVCPEAGCSSVECHAWNTLTDRYHQASDASLNVWILMPVALVVALVLTAGFLSKTDRENGERK